ncbi:MAG TPA: NADH-quinone oxidoreductase subunit M, partial [Roseiarcus sp.]|nr:NADH-quinone oxidoreductase subunit M [Roseiarcus sp.]
RIIFGVIEKANLTSILDLNPREVATLLPLGLLVLYFGVHPQPIIDASAASLDALLKGFEQVVSTTKTAGL